ncbi:MAG: hypothetical protein V4544_04980 [Pseudomonadota bacterium]
MSTYRTSMMLYSSVLALSLVTASEGFCEKGQENSNRVEKTSEIKGKSSEREISKTSEVKDKANAATKLSATPLSDAEEEADEKKKREQIEQEQKRIAYANKLNELMSKYTASLSAISGEDKEVIIKKLSAHSDNVKDMLSKILIDPKAEVFEKLAKGLKRKLLFIQSKKESVGEDAVWFGEAFIAAEKHLKKLEKLHAEFIKNKENLAEQEKIKRIYDDKINSFIASYSVFTACTHYLGSAKVFCNDKTISNNNMKVQFPDFSSKAFKEFAVPDDLLNGERAPLTRINGYSFYAIDKKEFKKGEFSKAMPTESEDEKLISVAKKLPESDSRKLLDQENGGLILSSRMIQKAGMDKPLCVFYTYALNGETEIVSRFSVIHETEENSKVERQLTAQLIKAENQPAYDALAASNAKLKKALAERKAKKEESEKKREKKKDDKDSASATDSSKDASSNKGSTASSSEDDGTAKKRKADGESTETSSSKKQKTDTNDKPKKKVTEEGDKPKEKTTENGDKPKAKATENVDKSSKKSADKDEKSEEKVAKDSDKPSKKSSDKDGKPKAKATEDDKAAEKKPTAKEEPKEKSTFFGSLFGSKDKDDNKEKDNKSAAA